MSTEELDQFIKACAVELEAIELVLERLRSGQLRITNVNDDIRRFEARAANLRKTIRQLRIRKKV